VGCTTEQAGGLYHSVGGQTAQQSRPVGYTTGCCNGMHSRGGCCLYPGWVGRLHNRAGRQAETNMNLALTPADYQPFDGSGLDFINTTSFDELLHNFRLCFRTVECRLWALICMFPSVEFLTSVEIANHVCSNLEY